MSSRLAGAFLIALLIGGTTRADDPPPPLPRVVVVGIDAATQEKLGPYGGAYRARNAQLIEKLDGAGVRGIGFDVFFPENPEQVAGTKALVAAAAASKAPVVVGESPDEPNAAAIESRPRIGQGALEVVPELKVDGGVDAAKKEFARATAAKEEFTIGTGTGETVILANSTGHQALALELASRTGDLRPGDLDRLHLTEKVLVGVKGDEKGKLTSKTREAFRPAIGDPSKITTVSYLDVLEGRVDPAVLKGALVLVGVTDGKRDMLEQPRPGAPSIASVYLHAFGLKRVLETVHAAPAPAPAGPAKPESKGLVGALGGD